MPDTSEVFWLRGRLCSVSPWVLCQLSRVSSAAASLCCAASSGTIRSAPDRVDGVLEVPRSRVTDTIGAPVAFQRVMSTAANRHDLSNVPTRRILSSHLMMDDDVAAARGDEPYGSCDSSTMTVLLHFLPECVLSNPVGLLGGLVELTVLRIGQRRTSHAGSQLQHPPGLHPPMVYVTGVRLMPLAHFSYLRQRSGIAVLAHTSADSVQTPMLPWRPNQLQFLIDSWCPTMVGLRHIKYLLMLLSMHVRLCCDVPSLQPAVLLRGPRGCGKSMLMNAAASLFDSFHTSSFTSSQLTQLRKRSKCGALLKLGDLVPRLLNGCVSTALPSEPAMQCGSAAGAEILLIDDLHLHCKATGPSNRLTELFEPSAVLDAPSGVSQSTMAPDSETILRHYGQRLLIATVSDGFPTAFLVDRVALVVELGSSSMEGDAAQLPSESTRGASAVAHYAALHASHLAAQRLSTSCLRQGSLHNLAPLSHQGSCARYASQSQSSSLLVPQEADSFRFATPSSVECSTPVTVAQQLDELAAAHADAITDGGLEAPDYHAVGAYIAQRFLQQLHASAQLRATLQPSSIPRLVMWLSRLAVARQVFDLGLPLVPDCADDVVGCWIGIQTSNSSATTSTDGNAVGGDKKRLRSTESKGFFTSHGHAAAGQTKLSKKESARRFLDSLRKQQESSDGNGEVPLSVCRVLFRDAFPSNDSGVFFDEMLNKLSSEGLLIFGRQGIRAI